MCFFRYILKVGFVNHKVVLFLFFEKCFHPAPISIPMNIVQEFPFLHVFASICYLYSFLMIAFSNFMFSSLTFVINTFWILCMVLKNIHYFTCSLQQFSQHHLLIFYWSIADLQCCISFRCATKWTRYTCIHSLRFFSHIGYCRALSRVPCALQSFISYLYFI